MKTGICAAATTCIIVLATASADIVACPEAVANGGFENGWTAWVRSGSATLSNIYAHGGTYSARDGGYWSSGGFYQEASIPSEVTSVTLALWLRMEYNGDEMTDNDLFTVEIMDGRGNHLLTLLELCELDSPDYDGWTKMSWDLADEFEGAYGEMYTGPIRIHFHSECEGSGYYTYWYIDYVSLEICMDESSVLYVDDDNAVGPWDGSLEHPYQRIQDGIDNASAGETVFVRPGYYTSDLPFCHQATVVMKDGVTVHGEDIATTVIDRGVESLGGETPNDRRTVIFWRAEGAVLENFTIRGFDGVKFGHPGEQLDETSSTLRNCVIEVSNTAVYVHSYTHPLIRNNTITAPANYGIECWGHSYPTIQNNIITTEKGIAVWDDAHPTILYNDLYCGRAGYEGRATPGEGDIQSDPLFVDGGNGDYHLGPSSPCVDAGDPSLTDPDGSRSDMGAFPHIRVVPSPTPPFPPAPSPVPTPEITGMPLPGPTCTPAPVQADEAPGLTLRVVGEMAGKGKELGSGDDADELIRMKAGTPLSLEWKITPGLPEREGDIVAGVVLPSGELMAFHGASGRLRRFTGLAETDRVSSGMPLDVPREGKVRLLVPISAPRGRYLFVAAVLRAGADELLQISRSNPLEID